MGKLSLAGKVPALVVPSTGIALADIAEGSIVKLNENGSPVEFYVACHNYESALNGMGRTLLVRASVHSKRRWDAGDDNAYFTGSDLEIFLNGDYLETLDAEVQSVIVTTKFITQSKTEEAAIFLLNRGELYASQSETGTCGTLLPIAEILTTVYGEEFWIRYGTYGHASAEIIGTASGTSAEYVLSSEVSTGTSAVVPVFTLPATAVFDPNTLEFKEA